jgi:Peptidase family C25
MANATKIIVVNRRATTVKYGPLGWKKIHAAMNALVKADMRRALTTRVLALDTATDAKKVGAPAIPPGELIDAPAVKRFIDAAWSTLQPDYIMLLGATDLLPQADLDNPLWTGSPDDDPDASIPTDLPYACDGQLVREVSAYRGPTRVVGRLPDLVGATEPSYLLRLLDTATHWATIDAPRPLPVFAISTLTWRRSTTTSVSLIGGADGPVHTCPADGPGWTKAQLDAPLVFVNCHGGEFDPTWYGEKFAHQATLPPAVDASRLHALVRPGTVVAAECCYGTMHWDPGNAGGQAGVASSWLGEGSYGVFGSSTTAYGPASGNANADVITRMFLEAVVAGASLGRAALTARQRYVQAASPLGPMDLKTLGQFELWGDPSIHPIAAVGGGLLPAVGTTRAGRASSSGGIVAPGTAGRRRSLESVGRALHETVATTGQPRRRAGITAARLSAMTGIALGDATIRSYSVDTGATAPAESQRYHIAFVGRPGRRSVIVVSSRPGEAPEMSRLERKAER